MTKREALMKLRLEPGFMICSILDFKRLIHHLGTNVEHTKVDVKGCIIDAVRHNGRVFIPCGDSSLLNCDYSIDKARKLQDEGRDFSAAELAKVLVMNKKEASKIEQSMLVNLEKERKIEKPS